MTTVLTVGTFDVLHSGHVALFCACRHLAGPRGNVVAGVNTDGFVGRYRGRPPMVPYSERAAVVRAVRYVDAVKPNDQPDGTMRALIDEIAPHYLVVGSDWLRRDYLAQIGVTADWLDERGIGLVYTSRPLDGPTSTKLKAAAS